MGWLFAFLQNGADVHFDVNSQWCSDLVLVEMTLVHQFSFSKNLVLSLDSRTLFLLIVAIEWHIFLPNSYETLITTFFVRP